MTDAFNPFAGIREAKTYSDGGNYFTPGDYEVDIDKMIWKVAEEGYQALIVEFKVVASNNEKIKVGETYSWFQKNNKAFKSEAKAFCIAAVGYDERNEAHAQAIKEKVEPNCENIMLKGVQEQKLKGRRLKLKVFAKPKKDKPNESFHKHIFSPGAAPLF